MRRNQTTEVKASLLVFDWPSQSHNVSELKAASLATVMALDLTQELLSLRCYNKQQSQKKNAASILVQNCCNVRDWRNATHLPTEPRIGATPAFSIQPAVVMR